LKKRLKETLIEKIFGFVFDIFHRIRYFIRIIRGNELYFHKEIKVKKELFGNTGAEWCLVPDYLNERSIIYSFGVGTDISFDLQVIKRIGCMVFAFDPTPRSIEWIKNQALPSEFKFLEYGISDKDDLIIFYPPVNPAHVSFSANTSFTKDNGIELPVYTLKSIMKKLGHDKIDLMKMDIEGSEYCVIQDLVNSGIEISQMLVEFHHRFDKFSIEKTRDAVKALQKAGFRIFYISPNGEEYSFIKLKK